MFTVEITKHLFLLQPACTLNVVFISYIPNLNTQAVQGGRMCSNTSYQHPNNGATFSLWCFADSWRNVMELLHIQAATLHFLLAGAGVFACLTTKPILRALSISQKATTSACMSVCLCVSLSVMNNLAPSAKMFMKPDFFRISGEICRENSGRLRTQRRVGQVGNFFFKSDIANELKNGN
jgi:hypothetical protein